jgi:sirohydrochlorin cobaltochelatase
MKGILLIGYGSNEPDAEDAMKMQAGRLKDSRTYPTYWTFTRVNKPTPQEALSKMAADGIDDAVVVPLIISDSMVSTQKIPELLGTTYPEGKVTVDGKEIRLRFASAVGTDPNIIEIFYENIRKNNGKKTTPILVIGHGSKDLKNTKTVADIADKLRSSGYTNVTACFNEFNDPTVEDAFADALSKADDLVLALPMFIAGGVHITRDVPPKIGLPERGTVGCVDRDGKKIMVVLAPCIGHDPILREAILSRVESIFGEDRRRPGTE